MNLDAFKIIGLVTKTVLIGNTYVCIFDKSNFHSLNLIEYLITSIELITIMRREFGFLRDCITFNYALVSTYICIPKKYIKNIVFFSSFVKTENSERKKKN